MLIPQLPWHGHYYLPLTGSFWICCGVFLSAWLTITIGPSTQKVSPPLSTSCFRSRVGTQSLYGPAGIHGTTIMDRVIIRQLKTHLGWLLWVYSVSCQFSQWWHCTRTLAGRLFTFYRRPRPSQTSSASALSSQEGREISVVSSLWLGGPLRGFNQKPLVSCALAKLRAGCVWETQKGGRGLHRTPTGWYAGSP